MTVRARRAVGLVAGAVFIGASMAGAEEPPVRVTKAWIREAPPVSTMLAGYMTLHNASDQPIALLGGNSASFARVEMHRTELTGDVARMIRQDRVEIPAGGAVAFEPGGYHLMLMKPRHPLSGGDAVALDLLLEGGASIPIVMVVMKEEPH